LSCNYRLLCKSDYGIGLTNIFTRSKNENDLSATEREYELAIQLPERITRIHVIQTDDPSGIEAYWHKRFASKRKHGEWFELDAADITAFKRRTFM